MCHRRRRRRRVANFILLKPRSKTFQFCFQKKFRAETFRLSTTDEPGRKNGQILFFFSKLGLQVSAESLDLRY